MNDGSLRYIPEPEYAAMPSYSLKPKPRGSFRLRFWITGLISLGLVSILFYVVCGAPRMFPINTLVTISSGQNLSSASRLLLEKNIIKNRFVFKALVIFIGGETGIKAGDYYFESSENALSVAWRMTRSDYGLKNIKITIPEGWSSTEIASFIAKDKRFIRFNEKEFVKQAEPYEGYLFPETYLFLPTVTAREVVDAMVAVYKTRIETLKPLIEAFGKPIKDIIIMASIIEEEARTEESRRIIAGILWKRLKEGMPLQVDAAFAFVNGKKASKDLTLDDLKIESPYNTYVKKGLPPGPISNPGLDSISATVRPISTKYYFYLTDNEGTMRYGITHDEHVANKFTYLK